MAVRKDAFEVRIDSGDFQKALDSWPGLLTGRVATMVNDVADLSWASIVDKTPVESGRARASWMRVKVNDYMVLIVSFLIYIRRLEVGWGIKRDTPERKIPLGGYRMVRDTLNLGARFIDIVAKRLAGRSIREQEFRRAA